MVDRVRQTGRMCFVESDRQVELGLQGQTDTGRMWFAGSNRHR